MSINLQGSSVKLMCSNHKIAKLYCENNVIYSSGNTVTYYVDSGVSYQEEVDESASCLAPKTFTPSKSGWTFVGWRSNGTATSSVYTDLVMGDNPITLYAVFRQSITIMYYNNSTTASSTSGYRYYNNGNVINPSFTLTQAARSGWTARGWSTSTAGNGGISYNNGAAFTRDSNITLYGLYYKTITLTYYNGSTSAASASGTRYYNPGSGGIVNPTFTLTPETLSGWTFRGWATSSAAAAGIAYSSISGTAFAASTTVYAAYSQTITLSYNGNGNTSGSTAAQTGTRYFNSGNYSNPSFTISANGFVKSGYTFSAWALGSAGGTQYAAGASVTLSASTTMYAVWIAEAFTLQLDANGWSGPIVAQGSFSTGPIIRANPYGTGVEIWGIGKTNLPFAVGGFSKTINTKGLPKADITVRDAQGSVAIDGASYDFDGIGNRTVTLSLSSDTSQTLTIYINNGGDASNVKYIQIISIYFHN